MDIAGKQVYEKTRASSCFDESHLALGFWYAAHYAFGPKWYGPTMDIHPIHYSLIPFATLWRRRHSPRQRITYTSVWLTIISWCNHSALSYLTKILELITFFNYLSHSIKNLRSRLKSHDAFTVHEPISRNFQRTHYKLSNYHSLSIHNYPEH